MSDWADKIAADYYECNCLAEQPAAYAQPGVAHWARNCPGRRLADLLRERLWSIYSYLAFTVECQCGLYGRECPRCSALAALEGREG